MLPPQSTPNAPELSPPSPPPTYPPSIPSEGAPTTFLRLATSFETWVSAVIILMVILFGCLFYRHYQRKKSRRFITISLNREGKLTMERANDAQDQTSVTENDFLSASDLKYYVIPAVHLPCVMNPIPNADQNHDPAISKRKNGGSEGRHTKSNSFEFVNNQLFAIHEEEHYFEIEDLTTQVQQKLILRGSVKVGYGEMAKNKGLHVQVEGVESGIVVYEDGDNLSSESLFGEENSPDNHFNDNGKIVKNI
mmetsp:Transcript_28127/g.38886  ORF Transcript_28127/g.38886 Transcript_28127/m.38886 type:complete len:251 (+) Transcript_28127:141-893(+)